MEEIFSIPGYGQDAGAAAAADPGLGNSPVDLRIGTAQGVFGSLIQALGTLGPLRRNGAEALERHLI